MGWDKCSPVKIKLKGDPKTVLDGAKKTAAKNDITLTGDEFSGKMAHKKKAVRGEYKVKGQEITITMEEDISVPYICKVINPMVKDWFKGK